MDREILSTDVATFMTAYLPFVPSEEDVDKCVQYMLAPHRHPNADDDSGPRADEDSSAIDKRYSLCHLDDGQLRFKEFLDVPTKISGAKANAFNQLVNIAAAIGTYSLAGRTRNKYNYRSCLSKGILSAVAGLHTKVDACITSDCEGNFSVSGIAVPVGYNLRSANGDDVREPIIPVS